MNPTRHGASSTHGDLPTLLQDWLREIPGLRQRWALRGLEKCLVGLLEDPDFGRIVPLVTGQGGGGGHRCLIPGQ